MSTPPDTNTAPPSTEAELESFRQKWKEEVSARARARPGPSTPLQEPSSSRPKEAQRNKAPAIPNRPRDTSDEHDDAEPHTYHNLEERTWGRSLAEPAPAPKKKPESALEHYEEAVRRETQGSLGDSVAHYRKAFKLDPAVQTHYKNKHYPASAFPAPKPKTIDLNPSNASATVPNTAHHSLTGISSSVTDLISSFSTLSIPGEEAPTDLSPAPPCPISELPEELLTDILLYVAIDDVAMFARLSQICKRMAYLVMTEDRVWRRIALGQEFGFAAMHYKWACKLNGSPEEGEDSEEEGGRFLSSYLPPSDALPEEIGEEELEELEMARLASASLHTIPLVPSKYASYRTLFRQRPRVRFNGCYISTVNYARPGANQSNSLNWAASPVLIVTYYRYLRLYRDGSCVSLLTTAEPNDVVPYLDKEQAHANRGHRSHLPQSVMKDALLGRWRLSGPEVSLPDELLPGTSIPLDAAPNAHSDVRKQERPTEAEGTLHIETEGVTPKYIYRSVLALSSAGRHARNNKLAWQGYWSYNRLTDDWGEFGLKNDKPFYWSRVRSWR